MMLLGFLLILLVVIVLVALFRGEGEKYGKWQSFRRNNKHSGSGFMF